MLEYIFILPLEYSARLIYLKLYEVTSNFGISIILLSLISNFIMLIAMRYVASIAGRESIIQKIMIPQIHKIKQESRGRERHNRITQLYKRYSYHPILSLRSAMPVFIQLPFLFAAYIMFTRLDAIEGVNFLFISNLKEPDLMLQGINLLPFVMTIVNIITTGITREFSIREKGQAWMIALLFMVLLYNAPSALLLFWTTNNVLLLIRTIFKMWVLFPGITILKKSIWEKIKAFFKNSALYPMLIAVYPALFLLSNNLEQATFIDAFYPIFISLLISIAIYWIFMQKNRNSADAAMYSSLLMFFIFYYGFFYTLFSEIIFSYWATSRSKVEKSHIICFILWFIFVITILIILSKINRKRNISINILRPLNIITAVICFTMILKVVLYTDNPVRNNNPENKSFAANGLTEKAATSIKHQPDIYYIILDGYARNDVLKTYFNYDNSEFLKTLADKGFYIADKSTANYPTTFLSLASSLNFEYVQNMPIRQNEEQKDRKELYDIIRNNRLIFFLKQKGYKFIHFQTGWGATSNNPNADIDYSSGIFNEFIIMWVRTSILSPVTHKIGITGNMRVRILKNFELLGDIKKINGPKFIFAHLVLPHPPFIFGPNGEDVSTSTVTFAGYIEKDQKSYLNQLKFTNKKVAELVSKILNDDNYHPYIIFQSDHGSASSFDYVETTDSWVNPDKIKLAERMSILNLYYFPDKKYEKLYKNITPVNTFRIVLNKIFDTNHEILEDKNYWSTYLKPFKITDVTEQLKDEKNKR